MQKHNLNFNNTYLYNTLNISYVYGSFFSVKTLIKIVRKNKKVIRTKIQNVKYGLSFLFSSEDLHNRITQSGEN